MKTKAKTKHNRLWLSRDVDRMMDLRKHGYSNAYIARELGRTAAAIAVRHSVEMQKIGAVRAAAKPQPKIVLTEVSRPKWEIPAAFAAGLAVGLLFVLV